VLAIIAAIVVIVLIVSVTRPSSRD